MNINDLFPDKILISVDQVDELGMSGFNFGTAARGWAWYYGKSDGSWWRSECGYTVDKELETCPICGESRPQ